MKKRLYMLLFAIFFLPIQIFAFTANGELHVYGSVIFKDGSYAKNSANMLLKIAQRVGKGEVKADLDFYYSTISGEAYTDNNYKPDFLVRQLYYRIAFEFEEKLISELELKAGFIKFTWGKSDELRFLDILNPQYLNFSIFEKIENRKIGRFAFSAAAVAGEGTRMELIFMPLLQKSIFNNYTLMPKKMQEIYAFHNAKTSGNKLAYSDPASVRLADASYGVRFRDTKLGFDYDLYFYHGYFNQPGYYWAPDSVSIYATESYYKINMLGFDFERNFGGFVFRGEVAYFFDRVLPVADAAAHVALGNNGTLKKDYLQLAVGFDNQNFIITDLYFNLQYAYNHIFDYSTLLLADKDEHTITAKFEYSMLKKSFKISCNYSWFIDRGHQINPEVYLKLDSGADLYFGAYLFSTKSDDYMFGNYDELDFGYIRFAVKF